MNSTNIIRTNARRIAWVMLACTSIAMVAEAAQAAGWAETYPSEVVSLRDLNLNTTAGVAAAYGRISHAAADVCGAWDSVGTFLSPAIQNCINEAVSRAVVQVHSPMLTGFYKAKTGKADKQDGILARAH